MNKEKIKCQKCGKSYEKEQFQDYKNEYLCPWCIEKELDKELIEVKINNVKVLIPKSYQYYVEFWPKIHGYGIKRKNDKDYYDNVNAVPPKIKLVNGLFELTFDSSDTGGYDVAEFKYYFKTKDDILNFLWDFS